MPVPIVNFMVFVLRNSLKPINNVITNVCTKGTNYEKRYGFIAFQKFGEGFYYSEAAMNKFIKT